MDSGLHPLLRWLDQGLGPEYGERHDYRPATLPRDHVVPVRSGRRLPGGFGAPAVPPRVQHADHQTPPPPPPPSAGRALTSDSRLTPRPWSRRRLALGNPPSSGLPTPRKPDHARLSASLHLTRCRTSANDTVAK